MPQLPLGLLRIGSEASARKFHNNLRIVLRLAFNDVAKAYVRRKPPQRQRISHLHL